MLSLFGSAVRVCSTLQWPTVGFDPGISCTSFRHTTARLVRPARVSAKIMSIEYPALKCLLIVSTRVYCSGTGYYGRPAWQMRTLYFCPALWFLLFFLA